MSILRFLAKLFGPLGAHWPWPARDELREVEIHEPLAPHLVAGACLENRGHYFAFRISRVSPTLSRARIQVASRFPHAAGPRFGVERRDASPDGPEHLPAPFHMYFSLRTSRPELTRSILGGRRILQRLLDEFDDAGVHSDGDVVILTFSDIPSQVGGQLERRLRAAVDILRAIVGADLFGMAALLELPGARMIPQGASWDHPRAPTVVVESDVQIGIGTWRRKPVTQVWTRASSAPVIRTLIGGELTPVPERVRAAAGKGLGELRGGRLVSTESEVRFEFPCVERRSARVHSAARLVATLARPPSTSAYRG